MCIGIDAERGTLVDDDDGQARQNVGHDGEHRHQPAPRVIIFKNK